MITAGGLAVGLGAGGDDQQKAAPLGLFVLLLIGVACYFLFKSMSRHLKRVRDDFPEPGAAAATSADRTPSGRMVADPATGERSSAELGIQPARPVPPNTP